ncbi:MAG: M23 family metallopeptidase [Candidatus Hydrogenedentes bacterium]|nr:M23 family metallopeptidase [Candidatus Hydrogenedentota bacterium]
MKKWTVMLIPHGPGSTRSVYLYSFQLWVVIGLLVGLSFTSAFLYKRHELLNREMATIQQHQRSLPQSPADVPAATGATESEKLQIERSVRAEYEARDAAITAELNELYDVEAQIRETYGLRPRLSTHGSVLVGAGQGGKGGGPSVLEGTAFESEDDLMRPPRLIYGLARPSADLIVQEINLRTQSLQDLLQAMEEQQARVARMPSEWPSLSPRRLISSGFGYRRDPFAWTVRHHDGTDISAPYGTEVVATGRGTVVFAAYDRWLGNLVRIDHGEGIQTWYGHLSEMSVHVGDEVERSSLIGKVGTSGRATGAHIHYEVHLEGRPVDPEKYLPN